MPPAAALTQTQIASQMPAVAPALTQIANLLLTILDQMIRLSEQVAFHHQRGQQPWIVRLTALSWMMLLQTLNLLMNAAAEMRTCQTMKMLRPAAVQEMMVLVAVLTQMMTVLTATFLQMMKILVAALFQMQLVQRLRPCLIAGPQATLHHAAPLMRLTQVCPYVLVLCGPCVTLHGLQAHSVCSALYKLLLKTLCIMLILYLARFLSSGLPKSANSYALTQSTTEGRMYVKHLESSLL